MKSIDVVLVRIYITESSGLMNKILAYLKTEAQVRGVSVFRAISGFGETGEHLSKFIDLSLDLPLVIEFFDQSHIVEPVLKTLNQFVKDVHIVYWDAKANG